MTPQLARDFSVLKIDLKVDGLAQTEIIHQMKNSKALAQLLDGQINKSKRHLSLLRERIEDMSSKVLVTGDLNAGKSTFCNALLRRKILPEDEQPCTSIFCEVLRAEDNHHVEEVHAIPLDTTYDLNNERTYEVHPLKALEQIVTHNEKYSQCKIYIKDIRPTHASLLNNKVLEIALIDAPGLNNDSLKTTEIFARQEEIDVVVFVVSAANHFTLSAREFIMDAAREKDFMFMVVNGFDNIKNKERCQEQILRQVANLSPATFKESSELVHFVSSNAVPVASDPGPGGDGGSAGSSQGSIGPDNDPDADRDSDDADEGRKHSSDSEPADPRNKGKERASQQKDFSELEASLRRFVLEKRARSKLAPAKTYLINVLDDLNNLAIVNRDVAQAELERVAQELSTLEPELNQSRATRNEASGNLDHQTEETATEVYSHTRNILNATIAEVSQRDLGLSYPGFWDAYGYAQDLITAMLAEVSSSVGTCEEHAREKTAEGTTNINTLGRQHLDKYNDYTFLSDKMFRRRKDALARQVDIDVDVWDFFDVVGLWERQEKVAGTGMAVTVAGVLGGRLIGGVGWVDGVLGAAKIIGVNNIRRLFIPGVLVGGKFTMSPRSRNHRLIDPPVVLTVGYMITTLPTTLPRRISAKLSSQLHSIDFIHSNALRISSEVRKALKYPADNLRVGLTRNFEDLQNKRTELGKVKGQSDVALKYFSNLVTESGRIGGNVRDVDLEGSNTQGAAIVNGAGDGNIGVTSRM